MCGRKSEGGDLGGVCLVGSVVVHEVGGVVVIGERWLLRRNFESRFACRSGTWGGLLAYGKWARSRGRLESMVTGGFSVAELCVAERNSGWVSCGVCFVASLCANWRVIVLWGGKMRLSELEGFLRSSMMWRGPSVRIPSSVSSVRGWGVKSLGLVCEDGMIGDDILGCLLWWLPWQIVKLETEGKHQGKYYVTYFGPGQQM